jgi:cytochrome c oxidase cbb3-type subunit III
MRRRLARTRNLIAVIVGVLAGADGQSLAQQVNPESSHQLSQSAQASAVERPGGMAAQWMKVPEVNITPGGVDVRPNIENPLAKDPSSVERGMRYFTQFNCVGCHAPNGGGGMGPALSNRFFKYGGEPANIFLTISHGRPLGMPSWGAFLPDEVIWDLVSYIKSISDAPASEWGHTISAKSPNIEQIPAEFQQTATPWKYTQPFSEGQKPTEHAPTGQQH